MNFDDFDWVSYINYYNDLQTAGIDTEKKAITHWLSFGQHEKRIYFKKSELPTNYQYTVSLCAMYKNEAKYLLEWIEYHRLIGVEHFYLYNNLSTDNHLLLLQPYIESNIVSYHDYNIDITNVHYLEAFKDVNYPYNHCIAHYKLESKYIGFIDIDEFIVLREVYSDPSIIPLVDFLKEYDQYSGLAIHWLYFGSTNNYMESEKLVTESYFLRPPVNHECNHFIKSIINPRKFIYWPNVHLPVMDGTIVRENKTICKNMHVSPPLHNHISLFHYKGKSKEYYFFTKLRRHINLDLLKTPIINNHRKQNDTFYEKYYGNALQWD